MITQVVGSTENNRLTLGELSYVIVWQLIMINILHQTIFDLAALESSSYKILLFIHSTFGSLHTTRNTTFSLAILISTQKVYESLHILITLIEVKPHHLS